METNITNAFSAAAGATRQPQASRHPLDRPLKRTRRWLAVWAIAIVAAIVLAAAWSGVGAGMTTEEFRQMYEGGLSADAACPQCVFP